MGTLIQNLYTWKPPNSGYVEERTHSLRTVNFHGKSSISGQKRGFTLTVDNEKWFLTSFQLNFNFQ